MPSATARGGCPVHNGSTPIFTYDDILASRDKIRKDLKNKSGIYQFINKEDPSKSYIGSSINFWDRIRGHIASVNNPNKNVSLLYRAIQKYGWNSFSLATLQVASKEEKLAIGQCFLDLYRPYYNILSEAGNSLGFKHSEESKQKMSEARIGFKHSEEARYNMSDAKSGKNNHFFGRTYSNETRDKIKPEGPDGTMIYVYNLEFQLLYTFPSSRAATSYFRRDRRSLL